MSYDIRTISGPRVSPSTPPSGVHIDLVCNKKPGTLNTFTYTMKFWHYKREQLSWEWYNDYGQNLILELNGQEIRRHTFKFGKGSAWGVRNNPTYYYPNNILEVSGEFTISGDSKLKYRTSCNYCENGYHDYKRREFNFEWGELYLSYTNPNIIPGKPAMSVSWQDNRTVSYNNETVYPVIKGDGTKNNLTVSGTAGANANGIQIDFEYYDSENNRWIQYKNDEGFNILYTNTTQKSITTSFKDNDRNYVYRTRIGNKSSTEDWSYSDWYLFRMNNLPWVNGNISANNIYDNIIINGINLHLPSISDTEENSDKLKYRLYYRTSRPNSDWYNWSYLGTYTSQDIFVQAEDYMSIGDYIQFGLIIEDSLEYSRGTPYAISENYKRNDQPPSKPIFSNVENGGQYMNHILPTINCNKDYAISPSIFKVQYSFRNQPFKPALFQEIDFGGDIGVGKFYDTENLNLPENVKEEYITLQAKTYNTMNNLESETTQIEIKLIMSEKPVPVILGVSEGGDYPEATPYCKEDPKISSYQAFLNGKDYILGTLINTLDDYHLRVVATHAVTGETGEASVNFKIDNRYPIPIEVYGVKEGDIKPSYSIHVMKQENCSMKIKLNGNWINTVDSTYQGRPSHNFSVNEEGDYSLYVLGTHNISTLTRDFTINKFTVKKGELSEALIRFKEPFGPVHSSQLILHSGSPILNTTKYQINNFNPLRYSSPLLIFDNIGVRGEDINRANESTIENKSFDGFINYKPELPIINGVTSNSIYRNPVQITFTNIATRPEQASYKIFLDGAEIKNPFNTTTELYKDGYHSISILGWDNINPYSYVYCFHTMNFLIKVEDEKTIRKPYIISYDNNKDLFVDVLVKFSDINSDFVHNIKITEKDGTISLNKDYDYNVKTVHLKVTNNCTIEATTTLPDMKISRNAIEHIQTIFDTAPLSNIKVLGLNRYNFNIDGKQKLLYIGKQCYLEIEKRRNEEYEVYVNGFPYELGTLIENKCEEIRKYTIEVVIKNPLTKQESYFSQDFLLDSINPAYPTMMSLKGNLMNRDDLPKKIDMKREINISDEDFLLNNRIIDVKTQKIEKDDEYILIITYVYYNGATRTNSFYFSVNSNPVDDLRPLRLQFKALDYKKSNLAKTGEFIIDRTTGHIYYQGDSGLKSITKPMEEEIHKVEEQLIRVEKNHELMQSIQFFMEDMISYVKEKQSEIIKEIEKGKEKLATISRKVQAIENNVIRIENEFAGLDTYVENIVNMISVQKANEIKEMTNKVIKLNTDFLKLCDDLKLVFNRASLCTDEVYKLKDEIATRITREQFNEFKAKEEQKFNDFVQKLKDKGLA